MNCTADITIKLPDAKELVSVVELARLMREESVYRFSNGFDELAVLDLGLRLVSLFMHNRGGYIKIAKNKEGKVIGMAAGQATPYMFNPKECMITDYALYVLPEYRGTTAAIRLLKDFEAWGKSQGANEMSLGVSTGIDTDKTHNFYTKMGYLYSGGIYKKFLNKEI